MNRAIIDLEKVERSQFEDVDDPGEGSLGAVGEQDHLQTTGHQGAVEDVLFQQNLPKEKNHNSTLNRQTHLASMVVNRHVRNQNKIYLKKTNFIYRST